MFSGTRLIPGLIVVCACLQAGSAAAEPASDRQRAAAEFDRGVSLFEAADFEAAAHAFLEADRLAPNGEALANALVAGRKASSHLLVARAAERALTRDDPGLVRKAREALAGALPHVARLEAACAVDGCSLELNGEAIGAGRHILQPGTHDLTATAAGGTRAREALTLQAGTSYRVVLEPVKPGKPERAARITETASRSDDGSHGAADRAEGGWSPAVFWVGAGLTGAALVATTWSGIDALAAKNDLPNPSTRTRNDEVRAKMTRSNILFGTTVVLGALTTWVGLDRTDWGTATVEVDRTGATVRLGGRF